MKYLQVSILFVYGTKKTFAADTAKVFYVKDI